MIGVGEGAQVELLRRFGAESVVSSLAVLLDSRLVDTGPAAARLEQTRRSIAA